MSRSAVFGSLRPVAGAGAGAGGPLALSGRVHVLRPQACAGHGLRPALRARTPTSSALVSVLDDTALPCIRSAPPRPFSTASAQQAAPTRHAAAAGASPRRQQPAGSTLNSPRSYYRSYSRSSGTWKQQQYASSQRYYYAAGAVIAAAAVGLGIQRFPLRAEAAPAAADKQPIDWAKEKQKEIEHLANQSKKKQGEEDEDDFMSEYQQLDEESVKKYAPTIEAQEAELQRQRYPRFVRRIKVAFLRYIAEPMGTAKRFVVLVCIFLPVLVSMPMLLVGSRREGGRRRGRRVSKREQGQRWGAIWWFGFLVRSLERAGPTFIKVSLAVVSGHPDAR